MDEKLFTPGPKEAQEGALPPKKGDRGPFGAGQPVDFNSQGSSDTEGDQVFREAPVQSSKSGQQALVLYSHRKPGRLAARLLLKMQSEVALGSTGATTNPKDRTTSNGDSLLPHHHGSAAGKQDEPSNPARAEDVGGGGGSPGEKSPSKGSRCSQPENKGVGEGDNRGTLEHSPVLELIPSEMSTLLERDEQAYVAKEYLQEMKVRNYEKPRLVTGGGGKKGDKGQGKGRGRSRRRKRQEQEEGRRGLGEPAERPASDAQGGVSRQKFARALRRACAAPQKASCVLAEAWRALDQLDSPLGAYARSCKGSGVPPSETAQPPRGDELLPLSPEVMSRFTALEPDKRDSMKLILAVLSLLAMGGRYDPKRSLPPPPSLSKGQEIMLDHLMERLDDLSQVGTLCPPVEEATKTLGSARFDYCGEPVMVMEELVAEKVIPVWPKIGEAAVQPVMSYLPSGMAEMLEDPRNCLRPEWEWAGDTPSQSGDGQPG